MIEIVDLQVKYEKESETVLENINLRIDRENIVIIGIEYIRNFDQMALLLREPPLTANFI